MVAVRAVACFRTRHARRVVTALSGPFLVRPVTVGRPPPRVSLAGALRQLRTTHARRQAGEFSEYPLPSPNGTACAPGNPTGGWGRPALALGYGLHAACTHLVAGGSRSDSPSARCIPSRAAGMGSERRNTGQAAVGVEAVLGGPHSQNTLMRSGRRLAAASGRWRPRRDPCLSDACIGKAAFSSRTAGVAREGPCVCRERPSSGHPHRRDDCSRPRPVGSPTHWSALRARPCSHAPPRRRCGG